MLLLLFASSLGCTDEAAELDLPPTELVFDGDQLRIHAAPGLTPCLGTGPAMEEMLGFLARETGLGPLDDPIDLYWLEGDDVQEACGFSFEVRGCSLPSSEAITSALPEEHELVHAYLQRQGTSFTRYSFLEEGLATVYGTERLLPEPKTTLEDALSYAEALPAGHYPRAGHFVSFLIDAFGPQSVAEFVMKSSSFTPATFASEFADHFGASLESVSDTYAMTPQRCTGAGWQRRVACDHPATAWTRPSTWTIDVGAGCSAEASVGAADGPVQERFVLEIPEAGLFDVRRGTPSAVGLPVVDVVGCGGCEQDFALEHDLGDGLVLADYPIDAGRYLVTTTFEDDGAVAPNAVTFFRN